MIPEDLIKYVFKEERVDYELRASKSRKRELIRARQRSMYLLKHFFPKMSDKEITEPFGKDRCTSIDARDTVSNDIATDKKYEAEMSKYIRVLRGMLNAKLKINCTSVMYKMTNKRAILRKTSLGYEITLKRLVDKKVEKRQLVLTDEAMQGLIECYNILHNEKV
jgi:hypothetical protein